MLQSHYSVTSASAESDCCSVETDGCSIQTECCSIITTYGGTVDKARKIEGIFSDAKKWPTAYASHGAVVEGLGLELELETDDARQDQEEKTRYYDHEENARRQSPANQFNESKIMSKNVGKDDVDFAYVNDDTEGSGFTCLTPKQSEKPRMGSIKKKQKKQTIGMKFNQEQKTVKTSSSFVAIKDQNTKHVSSPFSSSDDEAHWVTGIGRIVGLRLPMDVSPDFDEKNKPATHRRVNPQHYLALMEENIMTTTTATTTAAWTKAAGQQGLNKWRRMTNHVFESTYNPTEKATTTLLDIYLPAAHDPDTGTKNKKKKIRMVRNPNELVSATMRRLNMSVQKKVGGGSGAGAQSKSKKDVNRPRCNTKPLLLKRSRVSATMQSTTSFEVNKEIACGTLWDRFNDILPLTTNMICIPWNNRDYSHCNSLYEGRMSQINDDEVVANMIDTIDGVYELVEFDHFNSLTIDEMLYRAATSTKTDLDRYVLALPISTHCSRNDHPATNQQHVHFILDSCPPTITSVATFGSFTESHLFVRTPIVVEVKSLYATEVQITWFSNDDLVCANSSWYVPSESDVGKLVTVLIVPKRHDHDGKDREEAYQFARRVEALPFLPIVRPLREEFMPRGQEEKDDPSSLLRIVTYNILADQNASRDVEKENASDRSYSHCKNEHIVKWRRFPLIVHELLEYKPDIIALQEVDTDVYANFLRPVLAGQGYEGYFSQKGVDATSGVREGCAIFWSLNVFESVRPVDMQTHTFRDMIRKFICEDRIHKSQWKSLEDMSDLLDKHNHLRHVLFEKLGHVLQTVVLTRRINKDKVVVGNTHLFYHPRASHVRCLKMLMACRQLEIEHRENEQCPIILCGDLNSHPKSGLMKLLLNRYLDARNGMTWKHLCTYEWEEGANGTLVGRHQHHDVKAIDLEFPSSFPKFISAYPTPPDFTHYVEAFAGTLDYILMTENFEVIRSGPMPTMEDVQKLVAMPNENMPSDHVSLVCDVKWR